MFRRRRDVGKSITELKLTVIKIPQGLSRSPRFMSTYYIRLSLPRCVPFTFDIFQSALFSSYSIFTGDRIFNRNEVNIENSHLRISKRESVFGCARIFRPDDHKIRSLPLCERENEGAGERQSLNQKHSRIRLHLYIEAARVLATSAVITW